MRTIDHSGSGEGALLDRPLQVALLTNRRSPSVSGMRLADLIRSDGRFRLSAVLECEAQAAEHTRMIKADGSVATVLLSLLFAAEDRLLGDKGTSTGRDDAPSWPGLEPTRILCSVSEGHCSSPAEERIRALELDVIVDLDGTAVAAWLAAAARYGVWSVVPGGAWLPESKVTAFSEISAGHGTIAVTLLQRGRDTTEPRAIGMA